MPYQILELYPVVKNFLMYCERNRRFPFFIYFLFTLSLMGTRLLTSFSTTFVDYPSTRLWGTRLFTRGTRLLTTPVLRMFVVFPLPDTALIFPGEDVF